MNIVKNKWDPQSLSSPLRTYLYQHVGTETDALKYRPGPGEDEDKWEEAVSKRPGSDWVPLVIQGFFQLGRKAQIQMEAIQRCNMMLQEINTSLDVQLDKHRQNVATRLEECKRRQMATARRTLALAVKVQFLRNRGYVMDNAEEELKAKLELLQREVFDPTLNAREQEVWAHMLGIRERAKRLKTEMEKVAPVAQEVDPSLDKETVKAAKKVRVGQARKEFQTNGSHRHWKHTRYNYATCRRNWTLYTKSSRNGRRYPTIGMVTWLGADEQATYSMTGGFGLLEHGESKILPSTMAWRVGMQD